MSVVIETTLGDVTVDLYIQERPRTCLNFLKLCKVKAYNFCLFSHVETGFIAQTGDPVGSAKGGQSIFGLLYGEQARFFEAEQIPKLKHERVGTLSMVNGGANMLGSQFFITLGENLDYLDGKHCVFGEVVEGFDTLIKFNEVISDEKHIPYQDIRITHTVILDDPFDDPPGLDIPDRSPELTKDIFESGRIAPDEDLDEDYGRTVEEIGEALKDKEAKARATILEMVGDLPSADVAPPENVLFVCKLNPVTTDEDLMIIFSRFGTIKSCEVIRDKKTSNSLQYAFIEFDNPKSCEDAYFKMDNVLIDDRRIHVDFSQSVATLRWKGKGRLEHFDEKGRSQKTDRPARFDNYQRKKNPESRERRFNERGRDDRGRNSYHEKRDSRRGYDHRDDRKDRNDTYKSSGRSGRDYDDARNRRPSDKFRERDDGKNSRTVRHGHETRGEDNRKESSHHRLKSSDSKSNSYRDRDRKQKSSR